jgi:hypothetical protein
VEAWRRGNGLRPDVPTPRTHSTPGTVTG